MSSFSKSRPGIPAPSAPRKTANKELSAPAQQAQLKLKNSINSKPMMLNLQRTVLKERESFKNHTNPAGTLTTKLEAVKQILQNKVVNSISRNHTMKDLSLQATPTKQVLNLGNSSYDRNIALSELARSFDYKRNAQSYVISDVDKARERAEARRKKIQGLQTQMGGMLYAIDPTLNHRTQRQEPSEMHDVLFSQAGEGGKVRKWGLGWESQVSIKFPRRGEVENEESEYKPMISRKVLMGSDFSRLIQKNQRVRGPSLPPVPAQTLTRHRFLLRTKDG